MKMLRQKYFSDTHTKNKPLDKIEFKQLGNLTLLRGKNMA